MVYETKEVYQRHSWRSGSKRFTVSCDLVPSSEHHVTAAVCLCRRLQGIRRGRMRVDISTFGIKRNNYVSPRPWCRGYRRHASQFPVFSTQSLIALFAVFLGLLGSLAVNGNIDALMNQEQLAAPSKAILSK
jgi:hypothetical protein